MKLLFTALTMIASSFTFAAGDVDCSAANAEMIVHTQLAEVVVQSPQAKLMQMAGKVYVEFLVDESGVLHIEKITSADFTTEYYVRSVAEGMRMDVCAEATGKRYAVVLQFAA